MTDEWFRSPAWSSEDRDDFERRLSRARSSNRGQYLRIKGLALKEAGLPDAACGLWIRVLDDPGYVIERWSALEHLAELAAGDDPTQAESLYRQLLTEDPTLNATTGMAEVRLAALLIRKGTDEALGEADALLSAWQTDRGSPFPMNHFEWEVTLARWGEAARDARVTRDAARRALALVNAPAPFARHANVGVVQADPDTTAWLLDRAEEPSAAPLRARRGLRGIRRGR